MRHVSSRVGAIALLAPLAIAGQSPDELAARVHAGDSLYSARNATGALAAYESVLAEQAQRYDALWKAARSAVDLGEFERVEKTRDALFARARTYAQRAVQANGTDAQGYFELARATGRVALAAGVRERVRLAVDVRTQAMNALARDSAHAGALHIIGVWHAEILRLNAFERMMAKTFLGGKVMGEANWDAAARNLKRAAALEPERIVHRLDLGRVYQDTHRTALAREQFEWIARAPIMEYNDANYKRLAADALRGIK